MNTAYRQLSVLLNDIDLPYPVRWVAIKLLEKDNDITKLVSETEILKFLKKPNSYARTLKKFMDTIPQLLLLMKEATLPLR